MLKEAGELERRAASLTFTIATLDEERARLLTAAHVKRFMAAAETGAADETGA